MVPGASMPPLRVPPSQQTAAQAGPAVEAALPPLGSSKSRRSGRDLRQLDVEESEPTSSKPASVRRSNSRSLGALSISIQKAATECRYLRALF